MKPTPKTYLPVQIAGIALALIGLLLLGVAIGKGIGHPGEASPLTPAGLLLTFCGVGVALAGLNRAKKAKDEGAK